MTEYQNLIYMSYGTHFSEYWCLYVKDKGDEKESAEIKIDLKALIILYWKKTSW